jgi:transposase-like protein
MPKPGPRATYKYSDEFKATAVRLREPAGVEVQDVAASLYIHDTKKASAPESHRRPSASPGLSQFQ